MKRSSWVLLLGSIALMGCSSRSSTDASSAEPALEFDGVYASDVDERELTPEGSYRYRPEGCADEDCEEYGTFTYDAEKSELAFTLPDRSYSLSLEVEETDEPTDVDDSSLTTKDLITGGPKKLITRRSRLLRGRFGPLLVKRQAGQCTPTQIQSAQATCRAQCPGGSRGINYCTPTSFSCACKGKGIPSGAGGACGAAQRTFRSCMANAIGCGTTANCLGNFYNATSEIECGTPAVHDVCTGKNTR